MKNLKNQTYITLLNKIKANDEKIGIIGLGYVGLNLLSLFSKKNLNVFGFDRNLIRINLLKKRKSYLSDLSNNDLNKIKSKNIFHTSKFKEISAMDIIIITVPTPLNKDKSPNIKEVEDVINKIKKFLKFGQLVVIESTVYPGATKQIVLKKVNNNNLNAGENFFLSYSPERISPGDLLPRNITIKDVPKVVSGYSKNCIKLTKNIYEKIFKRIVLSDSLEEAEMSKLLENTFRAVNIGLVNEIKIICDKVGINVHKVINLAKTKPYGFTKFDPGPGIGGHCIPIDPFFLSWYAEKNNVSSNFIKHSGIINKIVKDWIFKKILDIEKRPKKKLNIFFLGVTYKKNVNDIRESPAIYLMDKCLKNKINVKFNDPFVQTIEVNKKKINSTSLNSNLNSIDVAILTADHDQYNYEKIYNKFRIIIDTRGRYQNLKNSKIIHA